MSIRLLVLGRIFGQPMYTLPSGIEAKDRRSVCMVMDMIQHRNAGRLGTPLVSFDPNAIELEYVDLQDAETQQAISAQQRMAFDIQDAICGWTEWATDPQKRVAFMGRMAAVLRELDKPIGE